MGGGGGGGGGGAKNICLSSHFKGHHIPVISHRIQLLFI